MDAGEITVHQVEAALRSQPPAANMPRDVAARQALDSLIDQEIAAQAAHAEQLDHDPEVVQALELARRDMLARLFWGRAAAKITPPTPEEVERFYDANPALFAQRRIYTVQELVVATPESGLPQLQDLTKAAHSANELPDAIRKAGMNVQSRLNVRAGEDLSPLLLDAFAKMGEGQSFAVPGPGGAVIYTPVRIQEAPLDRVAARDAIYAHILNERRRAAVATRMQFLKDKAKISYVGAFANPSPASPSVAASQAPT